MCVWFVFVERVSVHVPHDRFAAVVLIEHVAGPWMFEKVRTCFPAGTMPARTNRPPCGSLDEIPSVDAESVNDGPAVSGSAGGWQSTTSARSAAFVALRVKDAVPDAGRWSVRSSESSVASMSSAPPQATNPIEIIAKNRARDVGIGRTLALHILP